MEYRLLIWNIKNEKIALDNSKKMLIFSSVPLPMPLRAVPVLMPMHACVQPNPYLWTFQRRILGKSLKISRKMVTLDPRKR